MQNYSTSFSMKYAGTIVLMIAALFLMSCNNTTEKKLVESSVVVEKDSIPEIEPEPIDTSIVYFVKDDTAFFKKGETLICKTYLRPTQKLERDEEIGDLSYLMANCLIVLRNYHVLGAFCHMPSAESIEIYTANFDTVYPNKKDNHLFSYSGITSPDRTWGIFMEEAEGDLYGFTIFRSDGKYEYHPLNEGGFSYASETFSGPVFTDSTYTLPDYKRDFRNVYSQLTIYKNGSYRVDWPSKENDTIDFIFFNESEHQLYSSQPYWLILGDNKNGFYKESVNIDRFIEEGKYPFHSLLEKVKGSLMFSGISTSSLELNTKVLNQNIQLGDTVQIDSLSYVLVTGEKMKGEYITHYKRIRLDYLKDNKSIELFNDSILKVQYEGEKITDMELKLVADINGDTFTDFLLVLKSDLCHINIAILSDTKNGLAYKQVFKEEHCWD